jgi:NAD(P)-dependent dehydrogenase (short-subunit alcohol dehydrogenase family)
VNQTGFGDLSGLNAVVTGSSSGIGRAIAIEFARGGADLMVHCRRSTTQADAVVDEIRQSGRQANAVTADLADPDGLQAFVDQAWGHFDGIDVWVNNAGVEAGVETYLTLADSGWDNVLETNLKGLWLMSREFSSRAAAAGAQRSIINISSILAGRQQKGVFPYAVSKAGVNQATKIMALEGAKLGIRVNALAPGYIYTNVSKALLDSDQADDVVRSIPQRRFGEFSDLDGPLLLLASDASAHMTGSVVVVDGGHSVSSL